MHRLQIFTSYDLKIIALITMVIDHFGAIFQPDLLELRIIGRVAFILYAFMIAEGVFYTKNIGEYIRKLFLWAMISEMPFDLCFYDEFFFLDKQNVFWTLLFAVIGLSVIKSKVHFLIKIMVGLAFIILAYLLKTDYSWYGVVVIYLFYLLRNITVMQYTAINMISILTAFKVKTLSAQLFSFVGFIPIAMYNGKLGRKMGQIYYGFYAIHISLFYVLRKILNHF